MKPRDKNGKILQERIKNLLRSDMCVSHDREEYHKQFRASGADKARTSLDILKAREVDLARCAYFSIGGSRGEEIEYIMSNSPIAHGVLLEYDPAVTDTAADLVKQFKTINKTLVYVPGDATQQIGYCRDILETWHTKDVIDTMICSVQAVFHELPRRSPNFHLESFLTAALAGWRRSILVCREPCQPAGWPKIVQLAVPGVANNVLAELAKDICRHLEFKGDVYAVGQGFVEMPNTLAIETLFKVFYLEDYAHEIEEKVTTIDPFCLIRAIEDQLGQHSVSYQLLDSTSFEKHYREFDVQAREPGSHNQLPIPPTFLRLVGDSTQSRGGLVDKQVVAGLRIPHSQSVSAPTVIVDFVRQQRGKGQQPSDAHDHGSDMTGTVTIRRLRRRCRMAHEGSEEFRTVVHALLSRKHSHDSAKERFYAAVQSLPGPYERLMAHAAYLESVGAVSDMRSTLTGFVLSGPQESTRLLYEAIAHEKLDEPDLAIINLHTILETEQKHDIVRAAQFNLQVCYEKGQHYNQVRFESFIDDSSVVSIDGERLSDKAVAMHLICCMDTKTPFIYRRQLEESLDYLTTHSKVGYIKTLLTRCAYEGRRVSGDEVDEILAATPLMDANSKIAILTTLLLYLDSGLDKDLCERIRHLRDRSLDSQESWGSDLTAQKWRGLEGGPCDGGQH